MTKADAISWYLIFGDKAVVTTNPNNEFYLMEDKDND